MARKLQSFQQAQKRQGKPAEAAVRPSWLVPEDALAGFV
jgi:hypothetical protein